MWCGFAGLMLAAPAPAVVRVEFNAAVGTDPTAASPAWTRYGVPMTNAGAYLLQDNSADDPATQSGEYLSPSAGAGLMRYGSGRYGIEFRVRPRTDMPLLGSSHYANMSVTWSDDSYNYNVSIDKDTDDAGAGATGGLRYGQNAMINALTSVDWSAPHTVFVGHRGDAGVFDFYLDGELRATIPAASMARSGSFARDAVDFGDGTVGQGLDLAAEWYFVRVHDDATPPPLVHEPFADADGDTDVDQEDFGHFQKCLTGPGGGVPEGCSAFDRPQSGFPSGDNDVDTDDFALFQACMSGPDVTADTTCGAPLPVATQNYLSLYASLRPTTSEVDALITRATANGIRTLIPSLSGASASVGFVTPKENYLPELEDRRAAGFDALQVMIQEAHSAGMKVIPSVAVAPVNLLIFGRPEWETKDRTGQPASATYAHSLAFSYAQARQAKVAMLMDLVNGYAIDGIFLDYLRYPENTNPAHPEYGCGFYGYDPPLVQQCITQYGFDPRIEPVSSSTWNLFNGLRISSVTSFLPELRAAIAATGRTTPLGGFGDSTLANDLCAGRDWSAWAQGGHVQEVWLGNYVVPVSNMRAVLAEARALVGPNVILHGALTPYNNFLASNSSMVQATREMLLGGADRLWVYREDALDANNLWEGARLANDKFIRMKKLGGVPIFQFNAAAAGAGVEPNEVAPAWSFSGTAPMGNTGSLLLQNNTLNSAAEIGAYQSPARPGLMTRAKGNYAIEFRIRPLVDIASAAGSSAYANLHVAWCDDVSQYSVAIDKDADDGGSATTGSLRVGGAGMTPAVSGIDWSIPHTVRIVYDSSDAEFYFYLDNALANALAEGAVRTGAASEALRDRLLFGDSTATGSDAAAEWYSVRLDYNTYVP